MGNEEEAHWGPLAAWDLRAMTLMKGKAHRAALSGSHPEVTQLFYLRGLRRKLKADHRLGIGRSE